MIGRSFLLFLVILSSCAEPNYRQDSRLASTNEEVSTVLEAAFSNSGSSAWLKWEQLPTEEGFGSFLLKVGRRNRADNSPIPERTGADIAVELWMPSMGHGSSPVAVEEVDVGTYRATGVYFSMPGDWEVRIQRKLGGSLLEEAVFLVRH